MNRVAFAAMLLGILWAPVGCNDGIDTQTDKTNCGGCGIACPGNKQCVGGKCQ